MQELIVLRHTLAGLGLLLVANAAAQPANAPATRPAVAPAPPPNRPTATAVRLDRLGPTQAVGWGGGESMTFALKLAGIEGGRGAVSVGMPRTQGGRRSLKLRGYSETSEFVSAFRRIREEDIVHLDLAGLMPLEWKADRVLNARRRELLTTFVSGPITQVLQEVHQQGRTIRYRRSMGAATVLEALSALYLLRTIDLSPGTRLQRRVLGGLFLYDVEVVVRGQERIVVREHPRETIRLDGVARRIDDRGNPLPREPARKFSLWLGRDRARIPYRVRGETTLGYAEAELTSYNPPKAPLRVRLYRTSSRAEGRGSEPRQAAGVTGR